MLRLCGVHLEPVCEQVVGQHIYGEGHLVAILALLEPVCRIHDIFVWIRIRIRNPDTAIFVIDLQGANKKLIKKKGFSAYYF
jgi:hypothetical protein